MTIILFFYIASMIGADYLMPKLVTVGWFMDFGWDRGHNG
jgi:hypothetical protein